MDSRGQYIGVIEVKLLLGREMSGVAIEDTTHGILIFWDWSKRSKSNVL